MNIGLSPQELHDQVQDLVNQLLEIEDYDLIKYTGEDEDGAEWDPDFSVWWTPPSPLTYKEATKHFEQQCLEWLANPVGAMPSFYPPPGTYSQDAIQEWIKLAKARISAKLKDPSQGTPPVSSESPTAFLNIS
jgi:hypothetical protein